MGRKKKEIRLKEPVRIREKKISGGNISLYLDIYSDGVRKYESLSLYLVPEKDPISKDQNRHAMQVANKVKSERILGLKNRGIKQWEKIKQENMPLLTWLCKYEQSGKADTLNNGVYLCLVRYTLCLFGGNAGKNSSVHPSKLGLEAR